MRTRGLSIALAVALSACGGGNDQSTGIKKVEHSVTVPVGNMILGVSEARSVVLPDGRVVISGGDHANGGVTNIQVYSPASQTFSEGADLIDRRFVHSLTITSNGDLIAAGGFNTEGRFLSTAEQINLTTHSTTSLHAMCTPRDNQSAIAVSGNRIVFAGGDNDLESGYVSTIEIYDPHGGSGSCVLHLLQGRVHEASIGMPNDKVLVFGGLAVVNGDSTAFLNSIELIDLSAMNVSSAGNMIVARKQFQATKLDNGTILITGGLTETGSTNRAEIYDPATQTSTEISGMLTPRATHKAVKMADGRVLISGGLNDQLLAVASTEVFDPKTNQFTAGPDLSQPRALHAAELLQDGGVLVMGGYQGDKTYTATADVVYIAK